MQEYQVAIRALSIIKQQQKECVGRGSSEKFYCKNLEEDAGVNQATIEEAT